MVDNNSYLWAPPMWADSPTKKFMRIVEEKYKLKFTSYWDLHKWSVDRYDVFWEEVSRFCQIKYSKTHKQVIDTTKRVDECPKWFDGAELNYAENLLTNSSVNDEKVAIYFSGEVTGGLVRKMTFGQLRSAVGKYAAALKSTGIGKGDRVAGYMPNCPECVVAMLAVASLGAVWSSTSPDFGTMGVLERFSQVEPKVVFSVDAVVYNQKKYDHLDKLKEVVCNLPSVKQVVLIPFVDAEREIDISSIPNCIFVEAFLKKGLSADGAVPTLVYEQVPFDHSLFIMFSSGTTGPPKCMVHSVGGTLLKHLEEHVLQECLTKDDTILFYTTVGWMMWNWLVSSLATGASIVLYDGSPFLPHPQILFDLIDEIGITYLGMGAKCYAVYEEKQVRPMKTHNLRTLKALLSTGSPLKGQSFDYIYRDVKKNVLIGSISGGTDIIACFMGASWLLPVHRNEIQAPYLGCHMQSWSIDGKPLYGDRGELVCLKPFPSMPTHFLNDVDRSKYKKAYFDKFPVETFDEIGDSVCVGQKIGDDDERVVLFVKMKDSLQLSSELIDRIRSTIRHKLTARHVPSVIVQIADIPYTTSGKKVEIAIKQILAGEKVLNRGALANPQSLDLYANIKELAVGGDTTTTTNGVLVVNNNNNNKGIKGS